MFTEYDIKHLQKFASWFLDSYINLVTLVNKPSGKRAAEDEIGIERIFTKTNKRRKKDL